MKRKIRINNDKSKYTLSSAAAEFYKHNRIKGLAATTQDAYKVYVNSFIRWYGDNKKLSCVSGDKDLLVLGCENYYCCRLLSSVLE